MDEESEYLKLPIEDRCQHKLWKARVNGYEAATKLFNEICDDKSPEWSKYLGLVKKFVVDGNAVAQEKGLEAVLAYVENAGCAGKTCGEVMSGLVSKCLGAPKARTKERAIEIILMYIEIEKTEVVQEELMRGFAAKTPKIVATCIQVLREALRDFGPKVISLKPLVKQLPTLLVDRDKNVRDETKLLAVEIYRWIGLALKPQLTAVKAVQLAELESEFEKITPGQAEPTRYLRSQQALRAKIIAKNADGVKEDGDEEDDDSDYVDAAVYIDPFELLQPVDILSQLPKDFYDKVEAKKWQERKEAVDLLQPLTANPKLENGDYGDLIRALKKIIAKDTNVMVVAVAGKCLAGLATGLKKRFVQYVGQCFPVVLEKFKEKKQNVLAAMREAADAMFPCTTLEAIQEDVLSFLDNKSPPVKAETALFLARAFSKCDAVTLNKKLLRVYSAALLKILMNDPDPNVRDAAAESLGTAMKVVGEKVMTPFIVELDNLKMAKVKDCCEKAVVIVTKSTSKPKKTVAKAPDTNKCSAPLPDNSAPAQKEVPTAQRKPTGKPAIKSGGKTKKGATMGSKAATQQEIVEKDLSIDEVDEQASVVLPPEVINGLGDANWKTRLAAMEQFSETVKKLDRSDIPTQALVRTLIKKPGLKENNFQVLKLKLEAVAYLAANSMFTRRSMQYVVDDLAEKLGDTKNGSAAAEALTAIAEATKLDALSTQVLDFVFAQKNPKNQAEAMNWLAGAIKEFGFLIQVKPVIDNVKKALSATNPAVRTSAITLLGVMYMYMGSNLRMLFENEKAALLQQIDAEFEKLQGVVPPAPTRGLAPEVTRNSGVGGECEGGGGATDVPIPNVADLIPRTDISVQLTSTLLGEMADKNWKVRLEALQKLAAIINEVKFITADLGDLPVVFKARILDSNKNLAQQALNICQSIGTGMGPSCSKYARTLGPAMITSLGDSKNTVRSAASSCLNAWVAECGLVPFIEGEMLSDALKLENPNLRAELLGWLTEHMPQVKALPTAELALCLPYIYAALEDRSADVRKKAQDVVLPFMIHLGYDQMARQAAKLKPASKTQVMIALDKAKPNLPAKPAPPPTSKAIRGGGNKVNAPKASSPPSDVSNDSRDDASDTSSNRGAVATSAKGKGNRATSKTRVGAKTTAPTSKKKDEDVDSSPPIIANNLKDQRISDEQRLKVLKWNFVTPRDEFYELLKEQMLNAGFNRTLLANLFHNDFKFHLKSIDTFIECLENSPEATVANLDLILKWLALRFFDTNPSVLLKGLEYLNGLFHLLSTCVYTLHEYEAASFLPYLILKVGDPKDPVRNAVRGIFKLVYKVYPAQKMFMHLMEGLKSKNARQRAECLDELGYLIEMYGMVVCQPNPPTALKEVARHISDRDNGVRNAALNCIVQAYFLDNEKVYKYVGLISDKDMGLLEERIKRASKNRPSTSLPQAANVSQVPKAPSPESRSRNVPQQQQLQQQQQQIPRPVQTLEEQMVVVRRMTANRTPASRPVSGAFSLDLDKMEHSLQEKLNLEMPKLVQHDIDDILNEPIRFPVTKMRPPSPATKILNNSHDAASAMDLVISQVASNDLRVSMQASVQLDEFMKDESRAEALANRVDQLLVAASLQYRMIYTKHMGDEATSKADVVRLYRCLTMTLVSLFQNRCLAKRVSKDVLRDLIYNLVTILLDTRLTELAEGAQIVRTINVLVVKVVDKSDHTNMMSALIRLLHDCVSNDNSSAKFTELIMKCLWKMVRLLPDIINELNLDRVLLDLHHFLKTFPSSHWKGRPSDTPLRTVKTVLHSLAKLKGNKIMSHLSLIDNLQDSEIEPYLQKVLKGGVRHRTAIACNEQNLGSETQATDTLTRKDSRHSPRRLSKTTHEMLAEIFKKIGSKETTKEGLSDLYAFKKRYPEADIEPFLSKSSQFFQSYIERGLNSIEMEREGKIGTGLIGNGGHLLQKSQLSNSTGSIPTATVAQMMATTNSLDTNTPPAVYLERLKALRAKCGYDNSEYESGMRTITSRATLSKAVSVSGSLESQSHTEETTTTTVVTQNTTVMSNPLGLPHSHSGEGLSTLAGGGTGPVEDLRRRLERIKNATKNT